MSLLRLCLRELSHHPRFVMIFLLNAAIGLIGLTAVENFKTTFNSVLSFRSRALLGADLTISSRGIIPPEELAKAWSSLPTPYQESRSITLFSMATSEQESRLVSVRAIEKNFPFYGELIFDDETTHPNLAGAFLADNEVWIYPELALVLGIKIGDQLKVGDGNFVVKKLISQDAQQAFQEGAMALRLYMNHEGLKRAGLLEFGSTFNERISFRLEDAYVDRAEALAQEINKKLIDPGVSVSSAKDRSEQVGRTLNYLNDFLGLVSLVALFLSSVGLFYLYRSYIHRRREDMAILSCLGLSKTKIFRLYLLHLLILGFCGVLITWIFCLALFPLLSTLLAQVLPFEMPAFAGVRPFLLSFVVGVIGNLLLALPLLKPLLAVRANQVFQNYEAQNDESWLSSLLLGLPWLIFYWGLSVLTAQSWIIGSSFVFVFIAVSLLVFPLGSWVLGKISFLGSNAPLSLKLSLRTLSRFKFSTLSLFLSLVLATLLMTMVPTIERNLQNEISGPGKDKLPSLFMFDIQEEQVDKLKKLVAAEGIELKGVSPMILSRLVSINNEAFVRESDEPRTREEEQEFRIRNRGVNLTFRSALDASEKLISGKEFSGIFSGNFDEFAEVSVEYRYAKRVGIKLGDTLAFDVLDMPVKAKVVSIREVRWTSFMPNFFIVFQPGVLDLAPKTFLSVVPSLDHETKSKLQREIVSSFPNVSLIDVGQLITRVMSIMEQMSWALKSMALLSMAVGFFVLYSLAQHQMTQRERDITLLKVLGLSFNDLRKMVRIEFLILGFTASLLGAFLSLFVTWFFAFLFFDGIWTFAPMPLIYAVVCVSLLCLIVSEVATRKSLAKGAQSLLQDAL